MNGVLNQIFYILMLFLSGYYAITSLQWYSYRVGRVLFRHTKALWNYIYFLLPVAVYDLLVLAGGSAYSYIVSIVYTALFYLWYRGVDKKLVFTGRVKRFFFLLAAFGVAMLLFSSFRLVFLPVVCAWLVSVVIEKLLFLGYKKKAASRLEAMDSMIVIGVTASYGKTSIKNFIAQLLSRKYRVYATPRSVNTLAGVIRDINEALPSDTEVYIVEMGARRRGDIAEIASFVDPDYAVVGTIGPAHIEYFGSLDEIRKTKLEILEAPALKKAWVHTSAAFSDNDERIEVFGSDIENIEATLEGVSFTLDGESYSAGVLGAFNAVNLAVATYVAGELGIDPGQIREGLSEIEPIPHRLQRIDAGGKVILDDSFNGNIDGMKASFDLVSSWKGRKVLITPGLVEADEALNEEVASRANEVFDLIIVTGDLNYDIFKRRIDSSKLIKLDSKADMQELLAEKTRSGDLILFANDAPSFV